MNLNQYNDKINKDLSWRKKEISNLWSFINEITNDNNEKLKDIQYRAFILLLYSHLEWFIKNGGSIYLRYINKQNKKFSELKYSFFEIHLERQHAGWTKLRCLMGDYQKRARLYYKKQEIQTKSNINTIVLIDLLYQFWMDFLTLESKFKDRLIKRREIDVLLSSILEEQFKDEITKEEMNNIDKKKLEELQVLSEFCLQTYLTKILDSSLLEKRNWIAHGEDRTISLEELNIFRTLILSLLDILQASFYESLEQEQYLIKPTN